jgi:hypothetical protein
MDVHASAGNQNFESFIDKQQHPLLKLTNFCGLGLPGKA